MAGLAGRFAKGKSATPSESTCATLPSSYSNMNQRGQTLIIIVLVMMMALAVGTAVSGRLIKGLNLVLKTDSSSRALAVAEAAVERMLRLPDATLQDYIASGTCGADCRVDITGADGVKASATVNLSATGEIGGAYPISLETNKITEVNLQDYQNNADAYVCWDASTGEKPALMATFVYGDVSSLNTDVYAYNSVGSVHTDNGFSDASALLGYANCFVIAGKPSPQLLRLRAVYAVVDAFVLPSGGAQLPSQGILIEATGIVSDTVKKVSVVRSKAHLPLQFDFALFSKSQATPLSN